MVFVKPGQKHHVLGRIGASFTKRLSPGSHHEPVCPMARFGPFTRTFLALMLLGSSMQPANAMEPARGADAPSGTRYRATAQPVFRLDSSVSVVPTTIGLGLAPGELDFEPRSTSTGQAVTVLRRYENGDPLHVVATGVFPAGIDITLSDRVIEAGPLSPSDITQAMPKASVRLGEEVIELADLLDSPQEVPFSTPTMVEAVYRAPFSSHDVEATFQVRLFDSGDIWIRLWIQRPNPKRGSSKDKDGITKHLLATIGGDVVVDTETLPLYKNGSVDWERYVGEEQYPHDAWQDTARLQRTGLVPTMGWIRSVSEHQLNKLSGTYTPGRIGDYKKGMGAGGVTFELGPVTGWEARWLGSNGDARAWRSIIANTRAAGAYPIAWRNVEGRTLKPSDSPAVAFNGKNGNGTNTLTNGPYQFDGAHNPEIGYVAYLITGDTYFRELMEGNVAALYMLSKVRGEGVNKRLQDQIRQTAWIIRAIGNAAQILPDRHPGLNDLREWLWTQYRTMLRAGPDNEKIDGSYVLGVPWAIYGGDAGKPIVQSPWMNDFWTWAVAYIARTDALRGRQKAEAQRLARWMLKSVVGQLGGLDGNCPAYGAEYRLRYSVQSQRYFGAVTTAEGLYKDWPTLFRANFGDKACPGKLPCNGSTCPGSVNSHWAQKMPAIAEAFEYEMPGIKEKWDLVRKSDNFGSDIERKNWSWGGWGVTGKGQALDPL